MGFEDEGQKVYGPGFRRIKAGDTSLGGACAEFRAQHQKSHELKTSMETCHVFGLESFQEVDLVQNTLHPKHAKYYVGVFWAIQSVLLAQHLNRPKLYIAKRRVLNITRKSTISGIRVGLGCRASLSQV